MLEEKDLQALAHLIDARLDAKLDEKLAPIHSELSDLKTDVSVLKEDVSGLKTDVSALKEDVSGLKTDVSALKEDVSGLKEDVSALKSETAAIRLDIENRINPALELLAEGQQTLLDTMAPKSRVDVLEEELAFQKQIIKSLVKDVNDLKKAQ